MITISEAIKQLAPKTCVEKYMDAYATFGEEAVQKLLARGKTIANNINLEQHSISLLVGEVQSGKTAAISSVIANHFDNGSNFVVFTPATDTVLLNQTVQRMGRDHEAINVKVYEIDKLFNKKTSMKQFEEFIKERNNKVILLSLKNKLRLEQTIKLISTFSYKINRPLFIDDEGDQASFDNVNSVDSTTIHKGIVDIYNSHKDMHMLSVTATPMAHILVADEYKIKPKKAFYTEPGEGYFGIERFVDEDNNVIVQVDDGIDKDFFEGDEITPESFSKAIASFFISAAGAHLNNNDVMTTSMLVHVNRLKSNNILMEQIIQREIMNVIRSIDNEDDQIKTAVDTFLMENGELFPAAEYKTNDFLQLLKLHVKNTETKIVIGESDFKDGAIDALHSPKLKNYIFVGSSMLQRGVTIPNLIHTYFSYRSEGMLNADTVLQRARWFGYGKLLPFTKVFMTSKARADFISLSYTVKDIADKLKELEKYDLDFPSNFERLIYLPDANMVATRQSVIKNKRSALSSFMTNVTSNTSIIAEELFADIQKSEKSQNVMEGKPFVGREFNTFDDFVEHYGVETRDKIFGEISDVHGDIKNLSRFIDEAKPNIFIVNMYTRDHEYIERTVANNTLSISRGRSESTGDKSYVGDRYWQSMKTSKFTNAMIIHLYKIKIKGEKTFTYKLAISIPDIITSKFIHVVD